METKQYTTIDRIEKGWPSGEWDGGPDKVQWQDETTKMPCLAVRNSWNGNWCGYVGVSETHQHYGKNYDDVDADVHGGLTFADKCQPSNDESTGICHVPSAGEPDHVWWFGFDCAHGGDYGPGDLKRSQERGYPFTICADEEYRSLSYVKNQCAKLAAQLVAK